MTVKHALKWADSVRPNQLTTEMKLGFLHDIEGLVQTEIMYKGTDETPRYGDAASEDTASDDAASEEALSAAPPYDNLYGWYLCAMIDLVQGNTELYANDKAVFGKAYADFARWYQRTNGGMRLGKL